MSDVDPRHREGEPQETFFGVSNDTPPPSPEVNNERGNIFVLLDPGSGERLSLVF